MSIPTDHPFGFDPTYGFGIEALRAMRPPQAPPGFDAFWRARHAHALGVDPQPQLGDARPGYPDWQVHDISYTSTDALRIGGWLLLPRAGRIRRGLVVGHGYGGRDQPDYDIPVEETAVLFPCFRGLSRSSCPSISSDPARHVLTDIDQPERYVLGGCVADLWLAVSVLTGLYPQLEGKVGYSGISFGGGIGALAIAFDRRIDRGHLVVPTFGNMPVWLTLPTVGSGNAVQNYRARHVENYRAGHVENYRAGHVENYRARHVENYRATHSDVLETLRLFDAATAAARIEVPMLCAVARFDPAVAPPCQFSVANALPVSNHHESFVLDAGHFEYPGMQEQHMLLSERVRRFFRAT